jgi:penicillin-binding protein 2
MRKAIAVSSNVYFYQIGGGFGDQKGLGIANIEKYSELFGIGEKTGINISGELAGTVPSIEWKLKNFRGDPWRLGDTYHTAIGQYGFQVTPIQMLRAVAGIASRGTLVTPTILKNATNAPVAMTKLPFTDTQYNVVHDAMRMTVTEGTASALNNPNILVAAKTGTAQIKGNTRVNSWAIGFFPLEHPRFAFTVLMEDGPKVSSGATHAFKPVLQLFADRPELLTE